MENESLAYLRGPDSLRQGRWWDTLEDTNGGEAAWVNSPAPSPSPQDSGAATVSGDPWLPAAALLAPAPGESDDQEEGGLDPVMMAAWYPRGRWMRLSRCLLHQGGE